MSASLGLGILVLTLIISLYAVGAAIAGTRMHSAQLIDSARLATTITFPLLTVVILIMVYLLATGHFEFAYVYRQASLQMPLYLNITALWGGQSGSLLFWAWLLSGASAIAVRQAWKHEKPFTPWVVVVTMFTLAFFLLIVTFVDNPFARIWALSDGQVVQSMIQPAGSFLIYPPNGLGLNPLLRDPGMVFHPPMLYLGFVGFVIPFSFAMAALVTGRSDSAWLRLASKWALVAWVFLGIGLVLGSRWAYTVLGWGGYWGWDPVEVAALIPWLTGTAFVHSMSIQEKRHIFKRWNIALIVLTFCLVIFSTFLTRSGILDSVHAFTQSSIGPMFFGFICIVFIASLGLILWRWKLLESEGKMESFFSRESAFLFNNLLFVLLTLICLTGILLPVMSDLFNSTKLTVGPAWYKQTTGPVFAALLLLMGIVPLTAWGSTAAKSLGKKIWKPAVVSLLVPLILILTTALNWAGILALWLLSLITAVTLFDYGNAVFLRARGQDEDILVALAKVTARDHHRYGGYIVHIGIVMIALGVVGIEFYQAQTQVTVGLNSSINLEGFQVTYKNLTESATADGVDIARADVTVSRNGKTIAALSPRRDYYPLYQQSVTVPGVYSSLAEDLYVVLVDWQPISADAATFHVYYNPLINWFWIGSVVMVLGSILAYIPSRPKAGEKKEEQ